MLFEFDTPVVLVELDRLENNIHRMARFAREAGVRLRPMIKTHKSPEIAKMQLQAGATGVLVAKLGEAEVMAKAGIRDITMAVPLIGEHKLRRFFQLVREYDAELTAMVDTVEAAKALSDRAVAEKVTVNYLVKVDIGQARLGVRAGQPVVEFVQALRCLPNLAFQGIATHAGHAYGSSSHEQVQAVGRQEGQLMVDTRRLLEEAGIPCSVVAVGSTPTAQISGLVKGVTEIRPGNYVFNDAVQVALGAARLEDCALTILTTVISRPAPDRAVIDAGSKTLSVEKGPHGLEVVKGYGQVLGHPEVVLAKLSEELGTLILREESSIEVGDRLQILPNHACSVANLADTIVGVRGNRFEREIGVTARGRVQ